MSKNKEIVFFYQYFGTPKGRWSTRVYELCKRWVNAGHDVTVVTAPYDKSDIKSDKFIDKIKVDGIKLIIINSGDSNRFSKIKRVVRAINFSLISIWYSLTLKYDVCIASSGPITIGLPMIVSKVFRRKATVFEVRDLWPAGGIVMGQISRKWEKTALWFEKLCYDKSDVVVTASIGQREHIIKRFPTLDIEVIPNASDIDVFGAKTTGHLPEWTRNKILFTHIGSLGLIHNTSFWLEVAKELEKLDTESRVFLIFIGDGVDRDILIESAKDSSLSNIHFLGSMPKSDLPIWVQNSRATLFATLDNVVQDASSPNKIFDSFAASVPIIQTSRGWIHDLVEKENCGVNVSLSSPIEAAEKIMLLTDNEDMAKNMGLNAFKLAETVFNRDVLAENYINLMKRIV